MLSARLLGDPGLGEIPYFPQRQDAMHEILRLVLGGNYDGPVREVLADDGGNRKKVAVDLCTGTGLWCAFLF